MAGTFVIWWGNGKGHPLFHVVGCTVVDLAGAKLQMKRAAEVTLTYEANDQLRNAPQRPEGRGESGEMPMAVPTDDGGWGQATMEYDANDVVIRFDVDDEGEVTSDSLIATAPKSRHFECASDLLQGVHF